MKKRNILAIVFLGVFLGALIPFDAMASTTSLGDADFSSHATGLKNFLFGAPLKVLGAMGALFGVLKSVVSGSAQPLLSYGGIGVSATLIPTFVDGLFSVSGMLLP